MVILQPYPICEKLTKFVFKKNDYGLNHDRKHVFKGKCASRENFAFLKMMPKNCCIEN